MKLFNRRGRQSPEVLEHLLRRETPQKIADRMNLSINTVSRYRLRAVKRSGLRKYLVTLSVRADISICGNYAMINHQVQHMKKVKGQKLKKDISYWYTLCR